MSWDPRWLDRLSAPDGSATIVVGVESTALNFPEMRLVASAARYSKLVAGPVPALSHPIRLGACA